MSLVTVAGNACSAARFQASRFGTWWLDVTLVDSVALAGVVACQFADAALSGAIVSGGEHAGRSAYRIVGGRGGWGKVITAKGYSNDAGVKLSAVVADAAAACGEVVAGFADTRLGPGFARRGDVPASDVLHAVAPQSWRVTFDGVTRAGAWPTSTYSGDAPRTRVDPAIGVIELASDAIAAFVPGVSVDGSAPASDVEWAIEGGRLTARVYAGAQRARRVEAIARIVEALTWRDRYRGLTEYRVVTQVGERLNLQVVRVSSGLPDLANVPVRTLSGARALHALGSLVLVGFVDADPARPCVVAQDAAGTPGWMPLQFRLGEDPVLGVARITDPVQAGPFAGAITFASTRVKAGL